MLGYFPYWVFYSEIWWKSVQMKESYMYWELCSKADKYCRMNRGRDCKNFHHCTSLNLLKKFFSIHFAAFLHLPLMSWTKLLTYKCQSLCFIPLVLSICLQSKKGEFSNPALENMVSVVSVLHHICWKPKNFYLMLFFILSCFILLDLFFYIYIDWMGKR